MKKYISYFWVALVFWSGFSGLSFAHPWKKSVDFGLTVTQNSYSDNWAGGEVGNVSWMALANSVFEKKLSEILSSKTTAKFAFGQTHSQDQETKKWAKPTKSTDLLDIETLARFTLKTWVDPYLAFRFESQFLDASVPEVKRYFSPKKLTESVGVSRLFYKTENNEILSRLGFGLRQIITEDIVDTAMKKTEVNSTSDGGIESVSDVRLTLSDKISYTSKLSLYKALFFSESDKFKGTPEEDYWKEVDVNWENNISISISKYVVVSLFTQLLHDKEVSKKGRFKETLSLGLTYKLF
ncbi:MAG: hypothetical protein AMJ89_02400 [candidate division Zixibacteria bacterium SM23_73]|nr:MAG: hypothetical protein AMJ89_02400 [candidate division Zixibacteria bacterium SM23_73]